MRWPNWLNLRRLEGRIVALFLALLLVVQLVSFGAIHALQGVSLSIPESAKPGLYKRMRGIATAGSLLVAVAPLGSLTV